ncbi:MAG: NADH-quinone oxidoreductase subunit L [Kiritimatiellia bacterium]
MEHALSLIILLPLAGFLLNGVLATRFGGARLGPRFTTVVACGMPLLSFALAVACFLKLQAAGGHAHVEAGYTWAKIAGWSFDISFYLDRLSMVMVLIITGIGSLIHIYSAGYMKGDESYARYFAYLNLFLFFMLLLVLGKSLLVMFVGWEGVGLASYLLIGFWFDDPAKAAAGKKAFITNRVGDAGFLLGMFLLFHAFGTLDMVRINDAFSGGAIPPLVSANLIGILLFIGACGKSAQIPLHVWLPDAMAGPTPVSALIHAATMVTGGVYLVARMCAVYLHAPGASGVIAVVGAATAFFAATVAVVQTDIKKVLAYSTVSQLGLMFVALGVGAYGVAIFHVTTHAFFKACLFLGSGSVIHAMHGEQDILKMGGLARRIPVTFVTFAVATAAIAGIPPLAGFFSKDEILWFAFSSEHGGSTVLWAVASASALMTSFYMFRLLWLTFFGTPRMDEKTAHHIHESPLSMTSVLAVLAVLSAVGGFLKLPRFLEHVLPEPVARHELHHLETPLVITAVVVALAGLAGAWFFFGSDAKRAARLRPRCEGAHRVLSGKYFIDEAYDLLLARPLAWISDRVFLRLGDRVLLDGSLHGLAALARRAAARLGSWQTGSLQRYVFFAALGILVAVVWSIRHV